MPEVIVNMWNSMIDYIDKYVISTIKTMGANDYLDIILLAAVLFWIYRFARKRRAIRLVLGVVFFLLIMLLGDAMNLTALSFVLGDFRQLGVIAILIIFQPEFRSVLEKIGGSPWDIHGINITDKKHVGEKYVVEAISRAVQRLSVMRHGALIVIERANSLADYKRTGSTMDAILSPDTLCSIFYKGGALHDGAVIIKNGRIDSAACVLRMTDRVDIDSQLGTRHRAAIGTTEVSDAIVVVVSEETGTISLSMDGNLERGFNYTSLRRRLEEILVPAPIVKPSKKKGKKNSK